MPGLGKVSVEKLIAKGVATSVQLMGEFLCVPPLRPLLRNGYRGSSARANQHASPCTPRWHRADALCCRRLQDRSRKKFCELLQTAGELRKQDLEHNDTDGAMFEKSLQFCR